MRDSWQEIVGGLLRPARPRLDLCSAAGRKHLEERRRVAEERARATADCVHRIEIARAEVFAAKDGVVTSRMTDLEREWRLLSRSDPDAGLMDLWVRIAPKGWTDRKRWRGAGLDAAIALASDVEGVEAAEVAVSALGATRIRWSFFENDFDGTPELLTKSLHAALEALFMRDGGPAALERARRREQEVQALALARFPEREALARGIGHAAFVDCLWRAASLPNTNPVTRLRDLWRTGYVLSSFDAGTATVEIPPL